jgi:predicted metalloprotease with PDZ domain
MHQRPARSGADRRDAGSKKEARASRGISIGVRTASDGGDLKISQVFDGGAAQKAGLAAGDIVIALDGLRVSADNIDAHLRRYRPGETVPLHVFRRDELHVMPLTLVAAKPDAWTLSIVDDARLARSRKAWLGTD